MKKPIHELARKCTFTQITRSFAEREMGCPLDHCSCGTHDVDEKYHKCPPSPEVDVDDGEGKVNHV
jgi:hypothetical protein